MNLYSIHLNTETTAGYGSMTIVTPNSMIVLKPEDTEAFINAVKEAVKEKWEFTSEE